MLAADAAADANAVAERVSQGELAHPPRLIGDGSHGPPGRLETVVPRVSVVGNEVAAGPVGGHVQVAGRVEVEHAVLALRNDYRYRILNGTRGTVTAIDETTQQVEVDTDDGAKLTVPFAYAEAGHLTHGYALTVHKAHGATVDVALVLVDETMSREQLYTALSRGRLRSDICGSPLATCALTSRMLRRLGVSP